MFKKVVSVVLAIVMIALAVPFALAYDYTEEVERTYSAGYSVPNTNYFDTGNLTKTSNYRWDSSTDNNTETLFVDSNGNEFTGSHKTRFYAGSYIVRDYVTVSSGGTKSAGPSNFAGSHGSGYPAYYTYSSIRLRIKNGSTEYKYKTSGIFSAIMFAVRGAE